MRTGMTQIRSVAVKKRSNVAACLEQDLEVVILRVQMIPLTPPPVAPRTVFSAPIRCSWFTESATIGPPSETQRNIARLNVWT